LIFEGVERVSIATDMAAYATEDGFLSAKKLSHTDSSTRYLDRSVISYDSSLLMTEASIRGLATSR